MDKAVIEWSSIMPYSGLKDSTNSGLNENGFYIILTGKLDATKSKYVDVKLQYIGQTYKQTIKKRALQKHIAYAKINEYLDNNQEYKALIKSGNIADLSQAKISKSFFDDIESCLIFKNQPITNDENDKKSYDGRDIVVKNTGSYTPLEAESICKNNNQTS